ncbi:MAG TPA: AMP-binding protein [Acidimicrobiales bacterium]|nr:AMP-binding protein [Acidimicrobiales bacterium]
MNLAALVDGHPAEARAVCEQGSWRTWGEVRRRAGAVADGLARLGVVPGDRVALLWPTSVDFVLAYLGVLAAGAVAVPLNPNSPPPELGRELAVVEPALVLGATVLPRGSTVRAVVPAATEGTRAGAAPTWEELCGDGDGDGDGDGATVAPVERADDDLAVLLFTSGTAGQPRAAMLTHRNLEANLRQMLGVPDMLGADDVGLVALPLFHVFGLNVALGLSLATGAGLVLERRFAAAASLRLAAETGVTTLLGVPAMFAEWAALDPSELGGLSLDRVRRAVSGAAALDPEVAARFEARFGIEVWQGYGLTEASPAVATSLGTGRHRPGSVGRPLPGVEVRLVDETGEEVLAGDPGEIWVRGANVFAGYWGDPEATAAVVGADGWLHTGDVGVVGEHGDLYVVDRTKDLVIVSGFNVYPAEVERVLDTLPGVAEAVVVGRPDPVSGEAVEAVVVRTPGAALGEEDVRAHCASHLARYKCPASVRFVDSLPRGLVGKALRRAVREGRS